VTVDQVPVFIDAKGLIQPQAHQVLGDPLLDPSVRPLFSANKMGILYLEQIQTVRGQGKLV